MAKHELYLGGPARGNGSRSQFPSVPFDANATVFKEMRPAAHKGPSQYALTRTLDFGNDHALQEYVRNNAIAAADVLNLQVIPKDVLLYGLFVNVENPVAGVSLTFALDDGTIFATAVDCSVAGTMFVPPGGAAWITDGAADLGTAEFANVPKMLQATVTAVGAGGFGALRISVSPLMSQLQEGQY